MDGVQLEPSFGKPLLQIRHGRGIVVVEVGPCREDLDRFESVSADGEQMVAAQPVTVIEMR